MGVASQRPDAVTQPAGWHTLGANQFQLKEIAMKIEGACHCDAISYEAEVEPGTTTVCHCNDCQIQSGSAWPR